MSNGEEILLQAIVVGLICIAGLIIAFFKFTVPKYMTLAELEDCGVWDENGDPLNEYATEFNKRRENQNASN